MQRTLTLETASVHTSAAAPINHYRPSPSHPIYLPPPPPRGRQTIRQLQCLQNTKVMNIKVFIESAGGGG